MARIGADSRADLTGFFATSPSGGRSRTAPAVAETGGDRSLAGGVAHDFNNILMSIMGAADLMLMQLVPDDAARDRRPRSSSRWIASRPDQAAAGLQSGAHDAAELFALGDVVRGMDTMLRRLIGPEVEFEIVARRRRDDRRRLRPGRAGRAQPGRQRA